MVFNEGEAQRLIEILSEKAGIIQDTWHKATQKGDPVAILKRQLEEKEKLLATEQEDAAVAKSKLRELNKEMAAEKAKAAAGEAKVKKQLVAREQEITAVQARMQASYREHVKEVQQLQGKIRTLQEQLENGPNTQLARLQQENSILRDALNQATSQVESKQNAELAKLRQELSKVSKELVEKSEAARQDEQQRKTLEAKAAAFEKQVLQLQASHRESEEALQKRLDEVSRELCRTQSSHASLRADAEKAQEQQQQMAELHSKLQSSEAEVRSKCEELSGLHGQLQEARAENSQLTERIRSIEALLEAGQARDAQDAQASRAEADQQQTRLKELESQVSGLEKEATELREAVEQQKVKNNDLREKNWKAMEALATAEQACKEKLHSLTQAKEESEKQLRLIEAQTMEALLTLLPELSVLAQQNYTEWLQDLKEKGPTLLKQPPAPAEPSSDLASKLSEAEEAQSTLQAECDQYRSILAETEGMLRDLQKSVEEEEQVWRAKVGAAEEELQKSRVTVKHLEEIVEKLKGELESSDQVREHTSHLEAELEKHMAAASAECQNYAKEVAGLRQLLLESQSQLDAAKSEAQKQSDELALVRQQLSEMKSHVEDGDIAGAPASSPEAPPAQQDPAQLKTQLERTEAILEDEQTQRQKLTAEFEEAQTSACRLQEELEKLRTAGPLESSETEEASQLKERLEKEKKLTSDLGRAATKLQELLKTTQEQLAREKDTVKKLQEQLEKTEDGSSSKEGTSV
ncbi:PREDICTED: ribosome-binding protein 1 isoform X3 [Colobus angolensis palliatus]|nr:PREDICTED: ribosome-binding protein 1 isoform X3 [Colobus angolensis palliatus]